MEHVTVMAGGGGVTIQGVVIVVWSPGLMWPRGRGATSCSTILVVRSIFSVGLVYRGLDLDVLRENFVAGASILGYPRSGDTVPLYTTSGGG